jgi:site-specific DNA recombinase
VNAAYTATVYCAIYTRVSEDSGAEEGQATLDNQLMRCREYALRQGWIITAHYSEIESAYSNGDRPQFRKMLEDAYAGKFSHIVVFRADRFSRNLSDAFRILDQLKAHKVELHSTLQDLTDFLMTGIHFLISENESRTISIRVRSVLEHMAQNGIWPGKRTAWGVIRSNGKLDYDPVIAPLVESMYQRCVSGETLEDIHRWLVLKGHKLGHSTIARTLRNPIYKGIILWNGQSYQGVHEPLIDTVLWESVQSALDGRYRHRIPARGEYAVAGIARCGHCKRRLRIHRGTKNLRRHYFMCPFCRVWVRADKLEASVREWAQTLVMTEGYVQSFLDRYRREHERQQQLLSRDYYKAQKKITELERRLTRLTELVVDGTISRERYIAQEIQWTRELNEAKSVSYKEPVKIDLTKMESALRELPTHLDKDIGSLREALHGMITVWCYSSTEWEIV